MTTLRLSDRAKLLFAVMMLFVVFGPPIGTGVAWMLLMLTGGKFENPYEVLLGLMLLPFVALLGAPIGYLYGAAPAAVAGLAIGIKQAFLGRSTWPVAFAVGLLTGAAFLKALDVIDPNARYGLVSRGDAPIPGFSPVMIVTCLVATMLCWGLVQHRYFHPRAAMDSTP